MALAQAVAGLLDHRAGWDAMRQRARRFVETERTWARSVARYADVYARVCERQPGGSAINSSVARG